MTSHQPIASSQSPTSGLSPTVIAGTPELTTPVPNLRRYPLEYPKATLPKRYIIPVLARDGVRPQRDDPQRAAVVTTRRRAPES
jgi:hypothetical protein